MARAEAQLALLEHEADEVVFQTSYAAMAPLESREVFTAALRDGLAGDTGVGLVLAALVMSGSVADLALIGNKRGQSSPRVSNYRQISKPSMAHHKWTGAPSKGDWINLLSWTTPAENRLQTIPQSVFQILPAITAQARCKRLHTDDYHAIELWTPTPQI